MLHQRRSRTRALLEMEVLLNGPIDCEVDEWLGFFRIKSIHLPRTKISDAQVDELCELLVRFAEIEELDTTDATISDYGRERLGECVGRVKVR